MTTKKATDTEIIEDTRQVASQMAQIRCGDNSSNLTADYSKNIEFSMVAHVPLWRMMHVLYDAGYTAREALVSITEIRTRRKLGAK